MKRKWQPVVLWVSIVGLAWNSSLLREWVVPRDDSQLETASMNSARRSVTSTEELVAQLAAQLVTNQEQQQPHATAGHYVPLQSGWDASAVKLYSSKKASLAEAVTSSPKSVRTHTILPLEPVRTTDSCCMGKWVGMEAVPEHGSIRRLSISSRTSQGVDTMLDLERGLDPPCSLQHN